MRKLVLASTIFTVLLPLCCAAEQDEAGIQFFEKKIRPLLADNCYSCHSVKSKKVKAKLYADSREGLLKGGETGVALVPGEPDKSRIIEAVSYKNQDLQMPPESKLSDPQIADLTEWVKLGAPWPKEAPPTADAGPAHEAFDLQKRKASHWAWKPVSAPPIPTVKNAAWASEPLDAFVLKKLEEKSLLPAGRADKRALIRRASFDLIGLPPAPEEVDAFVKDDSPAAFEKVVDRLLASPHFGERWARHWQDLVRYAESHGHEFDFTIPNAYQYRDYVIRALNADIPYNQIVIEHLAGDLIESPRRNPANGFNESVLGTGFFELGEDVQAPVDVRQHQADRFDNMIDVTGKAFLGLTIACARCHDHKFDAISAADYYALYGYLKSSRFREASINQAAIDKKAAELAALKKEITPLLAAHLKTKCESLPESLKALKPNPKTFAASPLYAWERLRSANAEKFAEKWKELGVELKKKAAEMDAAADKTTADEIALDTFMLEESAFNPVGSFSFGASPNRPVSEVHLGRVLSSEWLSGRLEGSARSPSFKLEKGFVGIFARGHGVRATIVIDNFTLIRAPIYGDLRKTINSDGYVWTVFDVRMWQGHEAYVEFNDTTTPFPGEAGGSKPDSSVSIQRIVLSDQNNPAAHPSREEREVLAAMAEYITGHDAPGSADELAQIYRDAALQVLEKCSADLAPDSIPSEALLNALLASGALDAQPAGELKSLLEKYRAIEASIPAPVRAPGLTDGNGCDEAVFIRGSPKTPGQKVQRRFLEAVYGSEQPAAGSGSGRLELARRLTGRSNPLFARVMVNRVWHHLFGRGIVASTDNFGKLGEEPTHPELLDFLAARFVDDGYSVKKTIRRMMLSSAYQMSSTPNSANDSKFDPDNKFLSHQRIKRLEGEAIRDAMLAISGRLDRALYGPPVNVHLTQFMSGRGRPDGGPLDGAGRRSIYTAVRRNFIPPMMLAFDTPVPFSSMGRRTVSNVPAQALILLNDPFVLSQAELWSKKVLSDKNAQPAQRITSMYRAAFSREPLESEIAAGLEFIAAQTKESNEQAAWKDYAHVLMNAKEFVFVR